MHLSAFGTGGLLSQDCKRVNAFCLLKSARECSGAGYFTDFLANSKVKSNVYRSVFLYMFTLLSFVGYFLANSINRDR